MRFLFLYFFCSTLCAMQELKYEYSRACGVQSPIYLHVPLLRELAKECASVVEIGVYEMTSSWGLLKGLSENPASFKSYIGIDPRRPGPLELADKIAKAHDIHFQFWQENDMNVDIEPAELLFIDSLHTYCHLSYELEKFSPKITKYIAMHDTSAPWGERDDADYKGNFSEYPFWIPRNKQGTWSAVQDFLARHPEWKLHQRRLNCHGFTILKRISSIEQ